MRFHDDLIYAITHREVLEIYYDRQNRLVQPHAYGLGTNGRLLRVWQNGGGSNSGSPFDWKLMSVEKIVSLARTGTTFAGPHHGYTTSDPAMTRAIYAQL